jgi:hypothetical protein
MEEAPFFSKNIHPQKTKIDETRVQNKRETKTKQCGGGGCVSTGGLWKRRYVCDRI